MPPSPDFTLHLPVMDSDLMPEWLYEPGPEIPLTQEDIRRLYRNSTCSDDSLSLGIGSIRAPSPAELQSLWDDSESDSGSDDEPYDDDDHADVSDADTDSTSATLHDAQMASSSYAPKDHLHQPTSPQSPPSPRRHPSDLLRLYTYSSADADLAACLECIDEQLLCTPLSVYADVCYSAAVKRESQNAVSRGSSDLERVAEEEEEPESDESEDEPELHSPVQTSPASSWPAGVFIGNEPSEALSSLRLPSSYHTSIVSKPPRCFTSDPAAAEVAYLFLRTQYPVDPKDSVAAFPTHTISREPSGRHTTVRDIIRGFGRSRRDRVASPASA